MLDVWFLQLCLIFANHHFCCSNGQENNRTCTSPCNQCNFNFLCDPPPPATCIRENIALGKQVNMSSEFATRNSPSLYNTMYAACLAFDGNRSTMYNEETPFRSPNCIHTLNSNDEWLQVDLGKNYTVTNITVFGRNSEIQRLANILITVDNQTCYQFPSNVAVFPPKIPVMCWTPLTGRVVKLSTHYQYLNLCEIEVWVCKSGLYGNTCDEECHCKNNATCDNYYGTCSAGCDVGYYGLNCSLRCGHCLDMSQCNASGHCLTGCQNGWHGPVCDVCSVGFSGPQCTKCGRCRDSLPCNSSTGLCPNGCDDGYEKPLCNETCRNRMYGPNCSNKCGRCKSAASCDVVNGNCAQCETNFLSPLCIDCRSTFYGSDCNTTCGYCNNLIPCNSDNGRCPNGCADGYETPMCNEICREKMYGRNCTIPCGRCKNSNRCNTVNGSCYECESNFKLPMCEDCKNGFYGINCNKTCGFCKDSEPCHRENGTCLDGCIDGYEVPGCIEKCRSGTWGRQCQNTCGACLGYACRHDNGICERGCVLGYAGDKCEVLLQQNCDQDHTGAIVGSVLGAGLLISVSVIAVLIWLRRSYRKEKPHQAPKSKDMAVHAASCENHTMQVLNFHEDMYDKFETPEDAAKPYAVLGKESHDDINHSISMDDNYEKLRTQYQNTSSDSKPYEVLGVPSQRANTYNNFAAK